MTSMLVLAQFPTRLGWSPLALMLRCFYVLFIAREV